MTDPKTVMEANFSMLEGSLIANVINKMSFTSGNDRNDESQMARTISPIPPYGSKVFLSQIEIASKFIDQFYLGDGQVRGNTRKRTGAARPNHQY